MPITKSAKKALKRSRFLRERNLQFKIPMKKAVKAIRKGVNESFSKAEATKALRDAYSKIDRAAKRNILHWKAAGRLKSRLSKLVKDKLGFVPFADKPAKKTTKTATKTASSKTTSKASTKAKSTKTTTKKTTTKKTTATKKTTTKKATTTKTAKKDTSKDKATS